MGHVRMMAAVQPFLSGAISKTVNMPEAATAEEIEKVYLEGWKLGPQGDRDLPRQLQAQPAAQHRQEEGGWSCARGRRDGRGASGTARPAQAEAAKPYRHRLPVERTAITHKFEITGHEGYITVGLYADGQPGEIFLKMAKEGSTVSGLMDTFATTVSLALQYGVPLHDLVNKFAHVRFEPSGFTGNPEIPIAKSIVDYIFRWLGSRFLSADDKANLGLIDRAAIVPEAPAGFGYVSTANAGVDAPIEDVEEGPTATVESAAPAPAARGTRPTTLRGRPRWPPPPVPAVEEPAPEATRSPLDLPVVAGNGHANGHGKSGNGGSAGGGTGEHHAQPGRRQGRASSSRRTPRPAPSAARSWSATAAATSASTAAARAAAAERLTPRAARRSSQTVDADFWEAE